MKTLIFAGAIWSVFFLVAAPSVQSQTQEVEGYTFIRGATGPQVCLGRWLPPADIGRPGVCEGQMVDVAQLTAISSRLSADRLDQLILALASIDQKIADGNDQVKLLIEATVNTQTSIDRQVRQVSELLRDTITKRFDTLLRELLANDRFREELKKLKEDVLKEVERHYPALSTPSTR